MVSTRLVRSPSKRSTRSNRSLISRRTISPSSETAPLPLSDQRLLTPAKTTSLTLPLRPSSPSPTLSVEIATSTSSKLSAKLVVPSKTLLSLKVSSSIKKCLTPRWPRRLKMLKSSSSPAPSSHQSPRPSTELKLAAPKIMRN